MEVKKGPQLVKSPELTVKEESTQRVHFQDFLKDVKSEFTKITWTSPEELKAYTKIVVMATLFLGVGIYLMDLAIHFTLNILGFLVRLIG